ncbi:branched-chain amino acid aminotransferase [Nesterenkonia alkaliphila]|uniref:Branched-chain-amino-acid aminotransferase n=1 Tax=Nesterenkonia alkaliphila TaxID=1463631 RepID=A0A7K1UGG3_9MICC|nr:branched-chain amino acid aminotransferase [Nesterenkonia alkaliphila]MVT25560.1 branched-chain amino acid aminotransferase [Nesterenkonia alkaliphila]GFZ90941.1 branched-chain-amino-acid aminotransferase [Nesterenkonia alkaliphila]
MTAFQYIQHPSPTSEDQIAQILKDPGFGTNFTDHTAVIDWTLDGGWANPRVEAYGPIPLDPAASVLHYGQEIFEGLKAYKHSDGGIYTFRPQANAARLNKSAHRMALPALDENLFLESLEQLVAVDKSWVPTGEGEALYLRPFMFATEAFLGVRPAQEVSYRVIASPAGNYFGGELKPVRIWVSRDYARAAPGGTGDAKTGGNYAASLLPQQQAAENGCQQVLFLDPLHDNAIEELGGMNVFLVTNDGRLLTPELTGTILEGVTRSSVIQLAKDRGLTVEERRITLDEWDAGVTEGTITEVFACGTAAVITPIGELVDGDKVIASTGTGEVTQAIREELLGIQTGTVEDRHNWLHRLA